MLKEGERLDDLQNGLYVIQNPKYFCFGIDAVLLAHYPSLRKRDRILDMGTGSGVIPFIMTAACPEASIKALEIQEVMVEIANRSVEYNGLQDRIEIINGDIKEAASIFGNASFSLVTCNPPYTVVGQGKSSESREVAIARHEVLVSLEEIIKNASAVLKESGRLCMIHRPSRIPEIFDLMKKYRLEPKRMRLVQPHEGQEANLVLIEAVKGAKPYLIVEPTLMVYGPDGQYTSDILEIYGKKELSK